MGFSRKKLIKRVRFGAMKDWWFEGWNQVVVREQSIYCIILYVLMEALWSMEALCTTPSWDAHDLTIRYLTYLYLLLTS